MERAGRVRVVCLAIVPGEPTPKKRPRCSRGRAHSAEGQKAAEDAFAWAVKAQNVGMEPATGAVRVLLTFYSRYSFTHYPQRRQDADNAIKHCLDSLNAVAWIDDTQVIELHARMVRGAVEPRTVIVVYALD